MAKITIVPNTPPPPPPPPKEEKRPEPPKESPKDIKIEQPKQEQQQPQQAEQLKMEGQGSDTGLAGLAAGAVSQEYAGQKIGGDGTLGGTSNRMQFSVFTNALQRHLQEQLARNRKLRDADYRLVVKVWLDRGGGIERVEVANSSGNREMDEAIRTALADISAMRQTPPEDLPQPVRVRIANRGA
jgi:protein TonB